MIKLDEVAARVIFGILLTTGMAFAGLSLFVFFYNPSGWFLIWPFHVSWMIIGGSLIAVYIIAWRKKFLD